MNSFYLSFLSCYLPLFKNTEVQLKFVEDDFYNCVKDWDSDYKMDTDNVKQEFFDCPECI